MSFPMIAMHKAKFDINGKHTCSRHCCNSPVQTCSSACVVIAMCFVAVASYCPRRVWKHLCSLQSAAADIAQPHLVLFYHASRYAPFLRTTLATWILRQKIDIHNIVDIKLQPEKICHLAENQGNIRGISWNFPKRFVSTAYACIFTVKLKYAMYLVSAKP